MKTLIDLFHEFGKRGEKTALIHRTGVRRFSCSYEALSTYSLLLNGWLAGNGIGRGDKVLIWAPNGPWWVIAFWGCIARGAIVVPVDFMSGRERAETIAGLTDVRLVIQSSYKAEKLTGRPAVFLEDLAHILKDAEPLPETLDTVPDDIAQIIYTSGTTGNPKGVMLTHRNLVANLLQVNEHISVVGPEFVFLSLLPLSHMFEQMAGFLTPLYRGSSIVYLRTLKPSAIMACLHDEDIYAVVAVPRLLQLLRNSIERQLAQLHLSGLFRRLLALAENLPIKARKLLFSPIQRKFGRNYTMFVSGGAALAPDDFRFWNSMGFTVIEGYGLTECSPVLAANAFDRQLPGSVGKALPGVTIRLVNDELLAKGDSIFSGYYRNEQATREAFSEDGWFRTGDLAEIDREGNIYIKGRRKELIVTGAGINVYPDEIENLLNKTPGVRESCVIGLDRGGGEEVHAVLLLDGSGRLPDDIVREVNGRLDTLHRISGFSLWSEPDFPKTTTLKIRKFQVKEKLVAGRDAGSKLSADSLITLIAGVTGCPVGDIHENSILVADLGLTSIGRLELVNCLEQEFRLDLEDSVIDQKTNVADLRAVIKRREVLRRGHRLRFWINGTAARNIRKLGDLVLHSPLFHHWVTLQTSGIEKLSTMQAPVMFIANHISYFDHPAVMFSLPRQWRYTTATAAWQEFFFPVSASAPMKIWKRLAYEYGTAVLNLFPLPQSGGFREALHFMGKLADNELNILLFPEGRRSTDGSIAPFQQGLGIMVKELRVPVVPIGIFGMENVFPRGARWPKRGKVTVVFGKPLYFTQESPAEIVAIARAAIEELAAGASA
jgi:long-chain acyl-CoA synthetase